MTNLAPKALTLLFLLTASPVLAQEWTLDTSIKNLLDREQDELIKGLKKAPERALRDIIDEETKHLEKLHKDDLEAFGKEAWKRLLQGREDGRLWKALKAELKKAGVYSKALLEKIYKEERSRLHTFNERMVYGVVDKAMRAALIDRLRRIKNARLEMARVTTATGDGRPGEFPHKQPDSIFSWRETKKTDANVDTKLPIPSVTFWSKSASIKEALFEKTYKTKIGNLRVTAAKVEGLANAKAGRVSYTDAFGRKVEGLGATFTARARFTGARGDFRSKDIEAATKEIGVRAHVTAMARAVKHVEATSTTIVTEKGVGHHSSIKAGAGAEARAHFPITIDLKLFKIRVIPYVSAHAGVSAEAHATFEVEYTGKLRIDLGASASQGIGAGAGIVVQIELGVILRKALERVIQTIARTIRPIGDFFMGRTWKGPAADTTKLRLTLDDLEKRWAETGKTKAPTLKSHEEVATRYAPVIHQRIKRGPFDLLRRVDFDGDWNTLNNFDNTKKGSDSTAWVYYDVKETKTHYYVTYMFYHSGRKSNSKIRPLRNLRRHENDTGGCIVVARKNAPRGREVEVVFTTNGSETYTYSGLERKNDKKTRWRTHHGHWSGPVRYVDEADHPHVDLDRTHPQIWISGKSHDVYGFTGRDDANPFEGKEGIVYYVGKAEKPQSYRDKEVFYGLRPMSELLNQVDNKKVFTVDRQLKSRGAIRPLPMRMRGDEGPDNVAVPPWAWRYYNHEQDSIHNDEDDTRDEWIEAGDLFVDPAAALKVLFKLPGDVSSTYLHNPWKQGGQLSGPGVPTHAGSGLVGGVGQ